MKKTKYEAMLDADILVAAASVLREHSTKPNGFVIRVLVNVLNRAAVGIVEKYS